MRTGVTHQCRHQLIFPCSFHFRIKGRENQHREGIAKFFTTMDLHQGVSYRDTPYPHFELNGRKLNGLTSLIKGAITVRPETHTTCPACCAHKASQTHASRLQRTTPGSRSRKRKRMYASGHAALDAYDATSNALTVSACLGYTDAEHGCRVDAQCTELCAGTVPSPIDPCVLSLVDMLDHHEWKLVDTQVPLYIPPLDRATAMDAVCCDTSGRYHLIEVKACRRARATPSLVHACYHRTGSVSLTCGTSSFPTSYYLQHQFQLYCMVLGLTHAGVSVASASVVRVTPTQWFRYPLDVKYNEVFASLVETHRTRAKKSSS